jgi:hypothetical protein
MRHIFQNNYDKDTIEMMFDMELSQWGKIMQHCWNNFQISLQASLNGT